jgi:hypothetical protein
MNLERLEIAMQEAERFLERARTLQQLVDPDRPWALSANRTASGAVRRASMELTRALTELRKPDV